MPIRRIMYADVSNSLSSNEPWINAYWWTDCRIVIVWDRLHGSSSTPNIGASQSKNLILQPVAELKTELRPSSEETSHSIQEISPEVFSGAVIWWPEERQALRGLLIQLEVYCKGF